MIWPEPVPVVVLRGCRFICNEWLFAVAILGVSFQRISGAYVFEPSAGGNVQVCCCSVCELARCQLGFSD